jgi:anti-sigma regulatory factor (Ser/Thr protein kinase)
VIQEWGFDREFAETVELLVSELMTNALSATRALRMFLPSPIRLWLMLDRNRVTIVVWDANPQLPVPKTDVPDGAECGRGLLLVGAMAERWGWTPTPGIGGKSVWCIVGPKTAK